MGDVVITAVAFTFARFAPNVAAYLRLHKPEVFEAFLSYCVDITEKIV